MKYHLAYNDLSLFYKIINKMVPIELPLYFQTITEDDRGWLRNDHRSPSWLINHIEERTQIFKDSFFNRTIHLWNHLSDNIKNRDLVSFQEEVKKYFWDEIMRPDESEGSSLSSDNDD